METTVDCLHTQARELRNEATALLKDAGLLNVLSSAGPVRVVGSYAYDLMVYPDIDFDLQLPHERDVSSFFELGRKIAEEFEVTRMSFHDFFLRPLGSFDLGLCWSARLTYAGRPWKLDIWGFGEEAYAAHLRKFEELSARLAGADRTTILCIKDAICRRPEYGMGLCSWDVYEAVTRHGVRGVEEFDAWFSEPHREKQE